LSDRLGGYSQHYSLNRGLVFTYSLIFVILTVIFSSRRYRSDTVSSIEITRVPGWLQLLLLVASLAAVGISIYRTSVFDRLFVGELFGSYLHPGTSSPG
jgi:purine-cytosine permease-like protein